MSILARWADKLADKVAPSIEAVALDIISGIPRVGAEAEMRRRHDEWMTKAELHRPYWTEDSRYFWTGDPDAPQLGCLFEYTFVRRNHLGLYTAKGTYSWEAFWRAGAKGLTKVEPVKPAKGERFYVSGDLADAGHPERWTIH